MEEKRMTKNCTGREEAENGREKGNLVKNEREKWDLSKNGRGEG
jgi:hypothetical protein